MYYKKIAGLFLFLSFQSHCMLSVNELPKKKVVKANGASVTHPAHRLRSAENYLYNEPFFKNKMIPDIQPVVMNDLDHRSNIQFISICKHLYKRYVQQVDNGKIYHPCLFTKHPFQYSSPVDFNVYFDCYNRALFHYAPHHEAQTKILLSIEDEIIQDASAEMLKKCEMNVSNTNAVMNFYRQQFTFDQYHRLVKDLVFFQAMLKRGVSPNANIEGMSLIGSIICNRKNELLKIFLENAWINMNARDEKGMTALNMAVNWNIKALKILLTNSRVDPNIQDKYGETVLHTAVSRSKVNILKMLLDDSRIDPNIQDKDGETVLHKAACKSNMDAIKMLLDDPRVDPNRQDKNGNAAIMIMAHYNRIEALKILLDHPRVDPNMQYQGGGTALMVAAARSSIETLQVLMADIRVGLNIQDRYGNTALMAAVCHDRVEALKTLLAEPCINPNIQNEDGMTALMVAAGYNKIEILKILLADYRVDHSIQNRYGNTALMIATANKNAEACRILSSFFYGKCSVM